MADQNEFLHGLEIEVEAELTIVESSNLETVAETPVGEWLYDPTEAERYEVGLRGLLGAVESVEDRERGPA